MNTGDPLDQGDGEASTAVRSDRASDYQRHAGSIALGISVSGLMLLAFLYCQYLSLDNWAARYLYDKRTLDNDALGRLAAFFLFWPFWACLLLTDRLRLRVAALVCFAVFAVLGLCFYQPYLVLSLTLGAVFLPLGWVLKWRRLRYALVAFLVGLFMQGYLTPYLCYMSDPADVVRTECRMRRLAEALEAYKAEWNHYPAWTMEPRRQALFRTTRTHMPSFQVSDSSGRGKTFSSLLPEYPRDVFSYHDENRTFAYYAPDNTGWILVSPGPDCVFDLNFEILHGLRSGTCYSPTAGLLPYTYDCTNGSISAGDIWRVMQ